jgi:hypothetical protein
MLAVLWMVAAPTAFAQGVAPPLGGSVTTHFLEAPTFTGWTIDDGGGGPVVVERDPNGQPWFKDLLESGPNPPIGVVAQPGDTFTVHEQLIIGGNLSWKDWHEEILNPDWEWVDTAVNAITLHVNGAVAPGLSIMNMPAGAGVGGSLWFDFDEAFPGDTIDIYKNIQYVGAAGTVFSGTIHIAEYPTPEPATMALLGVGSMAMLKRRRKENQMA